MTKLIIMANLQDLGLNTKSTVSPDTYYDADTLRESIDIYESAKDALEPESIAQSERPLFKAASALKSIGHFISIITVFACVIIGAIKVAGVDIRDPFASPLAIFGGVIALLIFGGLGIFNEKDKVLQMKRFFTRTAKGLTTTSKMKTKVFRPMAISILASCIGGVLISVEATDHSRDISSDFDGKMTSIEAQIEQTISSRNDRLTKQIEANNSLIATEQKLIEEAERSGVWNRAKIKANHASRIEDYNTQNRKLLASMDNVRKEVEEDYSGKLSGAAVEKETKLADNSGSVLLYGLAAFLMVFGVEAGIYFSTRYIYAYHAKVMSEGTKANVIDAPAVDFDLTLNHIIRQRAKVLNRIPSGPRTIYAEGPDSITVDDVADGIYATGKPKKKKRKKKKKKHQIGFTQGRNAGPMTSEVPDISKADLEAMSAKVNALQQALDMLQASPEIIQPETANHQSNFMLTQNRNFTTADAENGRTTRSRSKSKKALKAIKLKQQGLTAKQIAKALDVSERTVFNYLKKD